MNTYILSILSILFLSGAVFTSCDKTGESELAEKNTMNIKYGANAAQSMDVYLPAGRTRENTNTIIFIHGGSWNGGDKSDFNQDIANIRSQLKDYAIFNINYRLAGPQARFPAQMEDIQSAIDFIKNNAGEYMINAGNLALIGASAGAHLALLHAYKHNADGSVKAVVNLFGPSDLLTLYTNHPVPAASQPVLQNLLGTTPTANPLLYADASPINFVFPTSPATLILHGDADMIVPISQSTTLRTRLQQAGAKVEMHTYVGEGHGWFGSTLTDTYTRASNFIKQNVR
jgi:acetyl esterase/lipase